MTDEDKALVDRLFAMADEYDSGHHESWPTIDALEIAAHRIEAQAAEIEKLRGVLREVFEEWAGNEGFIPETAPEGYLLQLTKRMADIARAALGETK